MPSISLRRRAAPWLAGLAVAVAGLPAQAGLFDDEEARKAILDLRSRIQASDDATRGKLAEMQQTNAQLLEQVQQLRRSLLELNTQLEAQRGETARLRGEQERIARELADTQKQLKDASVSLDQRLRSFEPGKVSVDGKEFTANPDERRAYEAAIAQLRAAEFERAAAALGSFVQQHPQSGYVDSARFWLGNAHYGLKNYREAMASFRAMLAAAPNHPKAPEAMLALANCQAEMKDARGARRTIEDLLKAYPGSEAAAAAKDRLSTLKG